MHVWGPPQAGPPHASILLPDECAVHEELDRTGCEPGGDDRIGAAERVEVDAVERGLRMKNPDCRGEAADLDCAGVTAD